MGKLLRLNLKLLSPLVWALRIIVGSVFIVSGIAKLIDLWGGIYKIEQYFSVWDIPALRSIVFMIALMLSAFEFIMGLLLATGSYKRVAAWALLAMMSVMLVFSGYIYIANPVDDCGCFGDFIIISNGATFIKNIVLTCALIYLAKFNPRVKGLYHRYLQWLQVAILMSYSLLISLIGYNTQPLIDFRDYRVGTPLIESDDIGSVEFIYEKNGEQEIFSEDDLPDSSWLFVKRLNNDELISASNLVIMEDDEDITSDVIYDQGEQLLLLIPEIDRADISYTYLINEINKYITSRGGNMIGLLATNSHGMEYWSDISMADYELFSVEDTEVKELARGHISLIYLKDGIIQWKRTLSSIDADLFENYTPEDNVLDRLYIDGQVRFRNITLIHLGALMVLLLFDAISIRLKRRLCRKNEKKNVTLHCEK